MREKIVILHNAIGETPSRDEQDVLTQAEEVGKALSDLGHEWTTLGIDLDLNYAREQLVQLNPTLVFNLVESLDGIGRFIHFAPSLLEYMRIPYTGGSARSQFETTHKIIAKQRLLGSHIPTPFWVTGAQLSRTGPGFAPPYIIKPTTEDASVGIDDAAVVYAAKDLQKVFISRTERFGECFVEAFLGGREFNLSLLAGPDGPEVLPPAEIRFVDYPDDKPKIVGYEAKWEEEDFAYHHTVRSFDFPQRDYQLLGELKGLAIRCWNLFSLHGYARVDFRIGESGKPMVLEINANPCISPDAGYVAAAERAGIAYPEMVRRIISDPVKL